MATTALHLSGVTKNYARVTALDNLDLEVAEGRFFVLFGPSSVGKTTTLRTIAGLVRPDRGSVEIFGRDMTTRRSQGAACPWCSSPSRSIRISPSTTISPIRCARRRRARAEIDRRVNETAGMLRIAHVLEAQARHAVGGEQQRVALGRSLIRRPRILLLDEPLTNLDAKLRHDMRAELKRLHREFGMTVVYATPDELEALSMGEEIAVMRRAASCRCGTPDELYDRPRDVYVATKIGSPHMNIIDGQARRRCCGNRHALRRDSRRSGRAAGRRMSRGAAGTQSCRHPAVRRARLARRRSGDCARGAV